MTVTVATAPAIREATFWDVPHLVAMFSEFVGSSQYAQYVGNNPTWSTQAITAMIESDESTVFVVDSECGVIGMLGVSVFTQPFSGERIATEHFWWLDPEHRGHGGWLLKRAEKWARSKGAVRLQMMAPIDKPRVAETYERLGYTAVEKVFQRNL